MEVRKGDIGWFLERFSVKNWKFKFVFVPHDAEHKDFKDNRSLVSELQSWGYNVVVVPKTQNKLADVYAAGKFLVECRFNADPASGVPDGLKRLENYRKKRDPNGGYLMDPMHDSLGNCDAADAFRYLACMSEFTRQQVYEDDMNDYAESYYLDRNDVGTTGY